MGETRWHECKRDQERREVGRVFTSFGVCLCKGGLNHLSPFRNDQSHSKKGAALLRILRFHFDLFFGFSKKAAPINFVKWSAKRIAIAEEKSLGSAAYRTFFAL